MASDFDVLVLGAGAAGTFAAWGARGANVAVLDYGNDFAGPAPSAESLASLRKSTAMRQVILGDDLVGAERAFFWRSVTPKLTGPLMRFVTADAAEWEKPADEFRAVRSLAKGGLANVWGAQVYRFSDRDLTTFPFRAAELRAYYDRVSTEIGISGSATDDLAEFHGIEPHLQPETTCSGIARRLLEKYAARRAIFAARGIRIGKPRLAVLTRPYQGRDALRYDNLEFLVPRNPAYYSPHLTLDRMIAEGSVRYFPRQRALRYEETGSGVVVTARHVETGQEQTFRAKKLILCLGCISTAQLVLSHYGDITTRLPILETPMTFTPLLDYSRVGAAHEERSYSSDLSLTVEDPAYPTTLVGMIYNLDGMARSGLLFDLPVPASAALEAMRLVTPALMALQIYYPQAPGNNRLWIDPAGAVHFTYAHTHDYRVEKRVISALRRIGFFATAALSRLAAPGDSIHYGGCIPMRESPHHRYETDRFGKLLGTENVYVGDAAGFPFLPAKNLTYTIMANACRIGEHVKQALAATRRTPAA